MANETEQTCPECGGKVKPNALEVLDKGTVHCVNGHTIHLEDKTGALKRIQQAKKRLDDSVKKLGFK